MKKTAVKLCEEWSEYEKVLEQKSASGNYLFYEGMLTGLQFCREQVRRRFLEEISFSPIGPFCNICGQDPCKCVGEFSRVICNKTKTKG